MLALRSAVFNVLFYAYLIVLMVFGLPTALFGYRGVLRLANVWGKGTLWLLRVICGTRVVFRGLDNIRSNPASSPPSTRASSRSSRSARCFPTSPSC